MPSTEELVARKALLQQQLALLDERCAATTTVLMRKTGGIRRGNNSEALQLNSSQRRSKRSLLLPPPRPAEPPGGARILAPVHFKGSEGRLSDVMRRTTRRISMDTKLHGRRPGGGAAAESFAPPPARRPPPAEVVDEPLFARFYARGELPCCIEHRGSQIGLSWVCPLLQLDYEHYLPIFVEGLRCRGVPYSFVARQGTRELLDAARGFPDCIIPVLPQLITPLRLALRTRDPGTVLAALLAIQDLVMSNFGVGEALVPHYKQILLMLNILYDQRHTLGEATPTAGHHTKAQPVNVGHAILETLEFLERTGGPTAYVNIKKLVPSYESCCKLA